MKYAACYCEENIWHLCADPVIAKATAASGTPASPGVDTAQFAADAVHAETEEFVVADLADDSAPALSALDRKVVWISSALQICPLWCQRAAQGMDEPVWWDYHVILLARVANGRWHVWDMDSTLGMPVSAGKYFDQTFRTISYSTPPLHPAQPRPIFRVMDAAYYRSIFSSDRSHMQNAEGEWLAPPPEWPPIVNDELSFNELLDMRSATHGELFGLEEMQRIFVE